MVLCDQPNWILDFDAQQNPKRIDACVGTYLVRDVRHSVGAVHYAPQQPDLHAQTCLVTPHTSRFTVISTCGSADPRDKSIDGFDFKTCCPRCT